MKFEEEITDSEVDEIEAEVKAMPKRRPSRAPALVLTIFGALLVILIGGLASYYYYSFQSQGAAGEKVLKSAWSDAVNDSNLLLTKFQSVDEFDQLALTDDQSLIKILNTTNQTVRDGLYEVRAQAGLSIKASTAASKLGIFLDDYSAMLVELKRLAGRAADISDVKELDILKTAGDKASKSYDDLLLVGNGIIQTKLPRAIFDLPSGVETLLTKKIEGGGTQTEQQKAAQQTAEQSVAQFVQAWQNRDATSMSAQLTKAAQTEFKPGITEDSVDVTGFTITLSTVADDSAKVTIAGQLGKQTPDKKKLTENWEFVVLKQGDKWLIDRWVQKA